MSSYSRRRFVHESLAGLAGPLTLAGAGKAAPVADTSNRIDAHVHVWTNDFGKYPLAEGFAVAAMKPRTFLPEDILRQARANGVNRVVLIQMSYYRFDNSYMLDTIRQQPKVFRGVAIVDWNSNQPDRKMRELKTQGVRGFRIYPGAARAENWLDGDGFASMFECAAKERLTICPLIPPGALPALSRQCLKYPETPVAIDHIARIGAAGPIREEDVTALCELARYPKVKVKVSAFYALGAKKPPHLDLASMIRRLYDAFGPKRLIWASDCPFQLDNETYKDSISLIADRLDFLSTDDKDWMLRRSAEESFFS
jgi:predicted TIM-barrel fold metal-dependent hydrolase